MHTTICKKQHITMPNFWTKKNFLSYLLLPLAWLYQIIYWLKCWVTTPYKSSCPIICVGNLTVGGAGKTPTVTALAKTLKEVYPYLVCISRGYKGTLKKPTRIDLNKHTPVAAGDEPLLLAKTLPVWVGKNRVATVKAANKAHADLILMDDGYQNPSLFKDYNLLVIDQFFGIGNGFTFPAGPLRETVKHGIKRAQAILLIGTTLPENLVPYQPLMQHKLFYAKPHISFTSPLPQRIIAFAGIGIPEKFFTLLSNKTQTLVEKIPFPDHHFYTQVALENLLEKASQHNATLVTTEKDFVKIPPRFQKKIISAKYELKLEPKMIQHIRNTLK